MYSFACVRFVVALHVARLFDCVPVAQLDKASDYESEDWGFESLQGYILFYFVICPPPTSR